MNNISGLSHISRSPVVRTTLHTFLIVMLSFSIGLVDYLTGPDFSFSLFFLIPTSLAAWKMTRRLALFASLISSLTWLWVDFSSGRFALTIPVYAWNFTSRLISLLIVETLISSLRKSMEHEKQLSRTDLLTKALNSWAFREVLDREIKRSLRYRDPISLVYMDVDNFKMINDRFGHDVGDKVLATIANSIRNSIRQNDVLGRLGGDEFAILLVETGFDASYTAVAKLQETLMQTIQKNNWPISVSFGVLSCADSFCTPEKMINIADQLMYSVKKSTKNDAKFSIYSDIQEEFRYPKD